MTTSTKAKNTTSQVSRCVEILREKARKERERLNTTAVQAFDGREYTPFEPAEKYEVEYFLHTGELFPNIETLEHDAEVQHLCEMLQDNSVSLIRRKLAAKKLNVMFNPDKNQSELSQKAYEQLLNLNINEARAEKPMNRITLRDITKN